VEGGINNAILTLGYSHGDVINPWNEKWTDTTGVFGKYKGPSNQILISPELNVYVIPRLTIASESEGREWNVAAVLSSLQGVTCGGKQSWWQIDDEQFLRCCSRELEKGLIQSAGEFAFLDISDLSTGMAILFRGGRSLNVHQNLSKVLWPNF
jgi:hypothetical protein